MAMIGTSSVVDQGKSLAVVVVASSDTSFEVASADSAFAAAESESASGHDSALWSLFSLLCL